MDFIFKSIPIITLVFFASQCIYFSFFYSIKDRLFYKIFNVYTTSLIISFLSNAFDFYFFFIPIFTIIIFSLRVIYSYIIKKDNLSLKMKRQDILSIILTVAIVGYFANSFSSFIYDEKFCDEINLSNPIFSLEDSVVILKGGSTARIFNHHLVVDEQKGAFDITLPIGKNELMGFLKNDNNMFRVFGSDVLAPCSGQIVYLESDHPDQILGFKDVVNPAGNHIIIQCSNSSVEVLLAHLKQDSVLVQVDSIIKKGEKIGAVGNSGNTSLPHLHVHARKKNANEYQPVRIKFENEDYHALDRLKIKRYEIVEN